MWCSACHQDVPGIAIPEDGYRLGCARCQQPFGEPQAVEPAVCAPPTPVAAVPDPLRAPPLLDDWNLDTDLAAVTRIMQSLRAEGALHTPAPLPREAPPRATEPRLPAWHAAAAHAVPEPHRPTLKTKRANWLTWPALMLGMMAFACGAVLLTWSFVANRSDLWTIGLPAVLAGQALLVLGLVLQLEGLWQNNRETRNTLGELDHELAELREATTLLSSTQSSSGQSFYTHMAEGASPHLLLADVKGQLDLIAARLGQTSRRG